MSCFYLLAVFEKNVELIIHEQKIISELEMHVGGLPENLKQMNVIKQLAKHTNCPGKQLAVLFFINYPKVLKY